MARNIFTRLCAFVATLGMWSAGPAMAAEYDLVVYGGTSGGVVAAVQAARMGKSVVLVCPEKHLGGLSANGLGFSDTGKTGVIGGLSREFYHRVWQHYDSPQAWTWQPRESYGNRGQGTVASDDQQQTMWIFEPHVAEKVFEEWIAEYQIPVHRDCWLDRTSGVKKEGGRISKITCLDGQTFAGKMFIDATYEGDLMAAAGVSYHVGREANATYGEEHNGTQYGVFHHDHFFKAKIDPYVVPGDASSGLLPRISSDPPGEVGKADHRVQAYCYRMCLTNNPENRVPFPKPAEYDPAEYELLARLLEVSPGVPVVTLNFVPNRKTDSNNHGPFSTDNIGMNYDYPEASYERRREILAEHRDYQQGLMYFLANDQRVPEKLRQRISSFGLAKDEFVENDNWPYQIYVRESRRMTSDYVMTEADCLGKRTTPHPVGMGSYTMDSHNVQRYVTEEGFVQNEGDIGVRVPRPYSVAYESLVPRRDECENLVVPVCVSSSHIAYGSIRMEPVFMILGQSAATAASMAIDAEIAVQQVPYDALSKRLQADGQVLHQAGETDTEKK